MEGGKVCSLIFYFRFVSEKRKALSLQAVLVSRITPPNLLFTDANLSNSEIALIDIK